MKLEIRIGTLTRQVEIQRTDQNQFTIGGKEESAQIEAMEVAPNAYSILINGHAFEATVVPAPEGVRVYCRGHEFLATVSDPRAWQREGSARLETEGQQRITAPMPGKVIRILVSAGQTVGANQGLVVVEAMKMQNEIRAPRAGTVDRVFICDGQAVAAGEALVTLK
jgi:biotin carboxyl carrier protein